MKTVSNSPIEASRQRQRARAALIAATITPVIVDARPACPFFDDLVAAIHLALDATEPGSPPGQLALEACRQIVWKLRHNHDTPDYTGPARITRDDATVKLAVAALAAANADLLPHQHTDDSGSFPCPLGSACDLRR